jgi:short-subunit dehydrogenase
MKNIVITGSTRGIGYGLADAFLAMGCAVMVSGRKAETVIEAARILGEKHDKGRVFGQPCDVSRLEQVQALWDATASRFGQVDMWINNAGSAHGQTDLEDFSVETIHSNIDTNIIGTILGTQVALRGMRAQGSGAIYNMEGLGSNGMVVKGMTVYGTTKAAVSYFNEALAKEVDGSGIITGSINPGMVVTDLLTVQRSDDDAAWERQKRIFNILAERVETVAPVLARKMLENKKNGGKIQFAGRGKVMLRFMTAPITKRKIID